MKRLLEAELRPAENLVWCQQPRPLALVPGSLPLFFFGIPFFALPAFVFCNLAVPGWHKTEWSVLLLLSSFLGLFAAVGAGMLASPFWAYWKALRTVYAITDQRCLIIAAPRRCTVYSYFAGQNTGDLVNLHRVENRRGGGDLVFHQQAVSGRRGTYYQDIGFFGIQDVRETEAKVRELIAKSKSA